MSSVVNGYVDADEEHVVLLHRADDGRVLKHSVPADFAMYFRAEDATPAMRREWRKDPLCRGYRPEGKWIRTRWRSWGARRAVAHRMIDLGVPTFEGDVHPIKRWMADHPEVVIQRPRRCWLDLETDSLVPVRVAKKDGARILVWCVVGEGGEHVVRALEEDTDAAERRLLCGLYEALAPYDQVCAWGGDDFDFPVLRARTKDRRIDPSILKRWLRMDHMLVFRRMNTQVAESGEEKQSLSLESVAQALLGEGKDSVDGRRTYEYWAAGGEKRDELVRYCFRDTDLCRRIEEETGYLKIHQTVAEVCGIFPDTGSLFPTSQMDACILRRGRARGEHFPTVLHDEEREETLGQFKGSYNKAPPLGAGILADVHVVDFTSTYPSIIASWNMSWETKIDGPINGPIPSGMCRAPKTGVCFDATRLGLIPEVILEFMEKRKEYSALRASMTPGTPEAHDAERWTNTYKVVPNAMYGAQGNRGSRFYKREVAESISTTGAWLAQKTESAITERLPHATVVYVDTDGIWVTGVTRAEIESATKWLNDEVYPALLAQCGCPRQLVKLAYEKQFSRVVFSGGKNYVGRFVHYKGKPSDPRSKPEIKGVAYKRGDQQRLTLYMQVEVIGLLMGGMRAVECACGARWAMNSKADACAKCGAARGWASRVEGPTDEIPAYEEMAERWRARLLDGPLALEDVQIVKELSQPAEDYAQKTKKDGTKSAQQAHVRAAKLLAARGEDVGAGTKVAYVVVDADASPQAIVPACDFDGTCDRRYLWERVWSPTRALLESAYPSVDWSRFDAPPKERRRKEPPPTPGEVDLTAPVRRRKAASSAQEGLFR